MTYTHPEPVAPVNFEYSPQSSLAGVWIKKKEYDAVATNGYCQAALWGEPLQKSDEMVRLFRAEELTFNERATVLNTLDKLGCPEFDLRGMPLDLLGRLSMLRQMFAEQQKEVSRLAENGVVGEVQGIIDGEPRVSWNVMPKEGDQLCLFPALEAKALVPLKVPELKEDSQHTMDDWLVEEVAFRHGTYNAKSNDFTFTEGGGKGSIHAFAADILNSFIRTEVQKEQSTKALDQVMESWRELTRKNSVEHATEETIRSLLHMVPKFQFRKYDEIDVAFNDWWYHHDGRLLSRGDFERDTKNMRDVWHFMFQQLHRIVRLDAKRTIELETLEALAKESETQFPNNPVCLHIRALINAKRKGQGD